MTGIRASATVSALAACLGFGSAFTMHSVRAQDVSSASSSQWVTGAAMGFATSSDTDASSGRSADTPARPAATPFDLPSHPLAEALQAYGRVSDLFVMADAALLRTRVNS